MTAKPSSIPTMYNGTSFRSRFEAEFAQFMDECHVKWEYEKQSFLLPSGLHYWPDFHLPDSATWIETRGYRTEKGEQQLEEFGQYVGKVLPGDCFFVIYADGNIGAWSSNREAFTHAMLGLFAAMRRPA